MLLTTKKGTTINLSISIISVALVLSLTILSYIGFVIGTGVHTVQLTTYQEVNTQLMTDNKILAEKIAEAQKLLEEQKNLIKATEAEIITLSAEIKETTEQLEAELVRTKILDKGGD